MLPRHSLDYTYLYRFRFLDWLDKIAQASACSKGTRLSTFDELCSTFTLSTFNKTSMTNLIASGDIIYTPPIYICNIEKSFTPAEYRLYKDDSNDYFKNTLAGLRIKAEIACEQTDSVCTVTKFTEKVRFEEMDAKICPKSCSFYDFVLDNKNSPSLSL